MTDAKVAQPTTLVLRRTVNAPRNYVFDAWLTPEIMREFMGPGGTTVGDLSVDARVGGAYRITMNTPQGPMVVGGVYREIIKPERIQCTWKWEEANPADEHDTLLTLEFIERGSQTEVVLTHENFKSNESRDSHEHGWNAILDQLVRKLDGKR